MNEVKKRVNVTNQHETKPELLVVDSCCFSRSALCQWLMPLSLLVRDYHCFPKFDSCTGTHVGGIVLRLQGYLPGQIAILQDLAKYLSMLPVCIPVALVTGASSTCIAALLEMVGIPVVKIRNIRVIASHLRPSRVEWLLRQALESDPLLPGLDRFHIRLSQQAQVTFKRFVTGMLEESHEHVWDNSSYRRVYYQRYAILRKLRITGVHSFRCGRF